MPDTQCHACGFEIGPAWLYCPSCGVTPPASSEALKNMAQILAKRSSAKEVRTGKIIAMDEVAFLDSGFKILRSLPDGFTGACSTSLRLIPAKEPTE